MNSRSKIIFVIYMVIAAIIITGCSKNVMPEDNGNGGHGHDYEYVDLGLHSGTLWATCNVGASSPEDIGDYFAWGETSPNGVYDWATYKYGDLIDNQFIMTKYNYSDSLIFLEANDDAAMANWGPDWRMPTKDEWEELYLKTTNVWTTINGVGGRLLTGSNGNSIFLPATGFYLDGELYSSNIGVYWSNSLHTDFIMRGWSYHFDCNSSHVCGTYERNRGQCVRAVKKD